MDWINNSRFLITGGTSGIGLSIIKNLLKYNPAAIYTTGFKSKTLPEELRIYKNINFKAFDFSKKENLISDELRNFVKQSQPNYFVYCAGDVIRRSPFEKSDLELYLQTMNLNFHSPHQMIRILTEENLFGKT